MTAQVCGTCSRADCPRAGLVETCERWTNTDDEETMTFHETPPEKHEEVELGPTGTDALEYRIEKLLRENQSLAEQFVELARVKSAALDVMKEWCSGPGETQSSRTWYKLGKLHDALFAERQQVSAREILCCAIKLAMGPDPHSGLDPHPDTIDAITDGVLARIAVNNARTAKYKDEAWREQTVEYHAEHADSHITRAWLSIHDEPGYTWLSDLGQPEASHAGLRIDFLLFKHAKDNAVSESK